MKTVPLILANLKGFMRDWKYVAVLIGLPLVIVGMIFASFGYDSINIPIGTVDNTEDFNYNRFKNEAKDFSEINEYNSIESCLSKLTEYEVYGCIELEPNEGDDRFSVNIYHDNTKSRIGRRIRAEIEKIAADFNLNYSKSRANRTLENISNQKEKLEEIQSNFTEFKERTEQKINFIDTKISEINQLKKNISSDTRKLKRQQERSQEILNDVKKHNREFSNSLVNSLVNLSLQISTMENLSNKNDQKKIQALQNLQKANQSFQDHQSNLKQEFDDYNELDSGNNLEEKEKRYLERLNSTVEELEKSKEDLKTIKKELNRIRNTTSNTLDFYNDLEDLNASRVATSVDIKDRGVYRTQETSLTNINIGDPNNLNLLRLQTIYSTILVFISLFVSILVSQFITVKFINSKTTKRLKMVENISLAEYLSVFFSSLIIITVPMISVILFGQYLFELPLYDKIGEVALIVGLLCASVANFGIAIAYLVKQKSITLLIGNLLLVFLSFFSGFILPLEMMTPLLGGFGSIQPASLAQNTFDLIVLYGEPLQDMRNELLMMAGWVLILGITAFGIKEHQDV